MRIHFRVVYLCVAGGTRADLHTALSTDRSSQDAQQTKDVQDQSVGTKMPLKHPPARRLYLKSGRLAIGRSQDRTCRHAAQPRLAATSPAASPCHRSRRRPTGHPARRSTRRPWYRAVRSISAPVIIYLQTQRAHRDTPLPHTRLHITPDPAEPDTHARSRSRTSARSRTDPTRTRRQQPPARPQQPSHGRNHGHNAVLQRRSTHSSTAPIRHS